MDGITCVPARPRRTLITDETMETLAIGFIAGFVVAAGMAVVVIIILAA